MENGVPFTLGWTEESGTVFESVDTDEQLQQAIPKMLKRGFAPVEVSIPYEEINKYSKIIYMAKVPDKTIDAFECTDKTILLCTDQMVEYNLSTIVFSADNYIEDLQFIEL